ncbi:shieldin complex subunit 3 [Esox lucius]|uniref:Shieldin complex subunit 3 n=2 Tax=Esox lucius TaxID=8010 RepID=A0AAY5KQY3_ESOLU|nr:shieldin complex subunit 3 [Esox lucius]XP_010894310.1 shieldin complex subunit 3 [Esox lucius]XP_010894311.1 shieldin complex subunit 3 [Esox lucius]XP_010894312.1 shieldin complex subunit 3 [Esox lucius]XP_019907969.1 shieldin complex subunit 3 [Esox lucius]
MGIQNPMDVLLYYKTNDGGLKLLVDKSEKALEDFPCRVLPTFKPWFPPEQDYSLPIRPLKAPPVISLEDLENLQKCLLPADIAEPLLCEESLQNVALTSLGRSMLHAQACSEPGKAAQNEYNLQRKLQSPKERRSWSVVSHHGLFLQGTQSFSKRFHRVVWMHRLHMRQRAKWVIDELNCVTSNIEKIWRELNQAIRNIKLPTCNANIQRDLTQIWVFCDVLYCEYVGHYLKEEFQLTGQITLVVHKLGNILSL